MNKYIIELLQSEGNIIIPKIGNLSATDGDLSKVMFNAYLKFDDGTLAKYISEKEGVDATEASNKLAAFTREIETQLDKGEDYSIYGLGAFIKNDDGEIDFKPDVKTSATPPLAKKEASKEDTPKKETPKTAPKKDVQSAPAKKEPASPSDKKKETPTNKKTEAPKETPKKEAKPAPKINEKKETFISPHSKNEYKPVDGDAPKEEKKDPLKHVAPEKKEVKKEEKETKTPKATTKKPPKKEKKVKDKKKKEGKKKKGWIIWLIIILLLAAGGTYVGLEWQKVKTMIGLDRETEETDEKTAENSEEFYEEENTEETVVEDETASTDEGTKESADMENADTSSQEEDAAAEESVEEEETVEEETPTTTTTTPPASTGGSFHIIVNSFENPDNAESFASSISGAQVINYGRLKVVSAGSYASRSEAQSALNQYTGQYPGAWVLKR